MFGAVQPAHALNVSETKLIVCATLFFDLRGHQGRFQLAPGDTANVFVTLDAGQKPAKHMIAGLTMDNDWVDYAENYEAKGVIASYTNLGITTLQIDAWWYVDMHFTTEGIESATSGASWGDDNTTFDNYLGDSLNYCETPRLPGYSSAVSWFNPNDSRVDGRPGDRLAVYCDPAATPPSVDVYGVEDNSKGVFLATFNNVDLLKAGPKGITKSVDGLGTISMMQDGDNRFYVAWNGGQFRATGQGDFSKSFTCNFAQ
jgi:hypothetical protein